MQCLWCDCSTTSLLKPKTFENEFHIHKSDAPFVLIKKGYFPLRPNKKISVFAVTGLKILSRVGTHIFF